MKEEQIIEIIERNINKDKPIIDVTKNEVYNYQFARTNMLLGIAADLIALNEQEKKNTLKEFVEWLKQGFDKRIEEQFKECNRMLEEGDNGEYLDQFDEVFANMEGILHGYTDASWWIEDFYTVENFLKEREK